MLKKAGLFVAITVLVQLTSTGTKAADVEVCALAADRAKFDHQNIALQGSALTVKETTSRAGNDYTTFKLQSPDGNCRVSIFSWGHLTLANGDHVRVDGVFETEHHQGRYTFYNEVEATKVTPLPR